MLKVRHHCAAAAVFTVIVFSLFISGCSHSSSPSATVIPSDIEKGICNTNASKTTPSGTGSSGNAPATPGAPADPVIPPVTPPRKYTEPEPVQSSELVDFILAQTETSPDNPVIIDLSFPEGEEDFELPDLSGLKDTDIYFELLIPEGVTSIGDNLQGLTTLTSVTIPDTVTSIDADTFAGCTGLTSISVPSYLPDLKSADNKDIAVDRDIFKDCPNLTEITFTGDIVSGKWSDAITNSNITKAVFDASRIGGDTYNGQRLYKGARGVLKGCTSLTEVVFTESVQSIGRYSFEGCTGLTEVVIPDTVTSVDSNAFADCTNLKSVTTPILTNAIFHKCTSLTEVTLTGSNITRIPQSAFGGCSSLETIILPETVEKIDTNAFTNCSSLTSIVIPDSVKMISYDVFIGCKELQSLTIPESVTVLRTGALKKAYQTPIPNITFKGSSKMWECKACNTTYTTEQLKRDPGLYGQYIVREDNTYKYQ